MKKIKLIPLIIIAFSLYSLDLKAQTVLFSEDFEASPVTSISNSGETELGEGSSPCGFATRGTVSDFSSPSIDMDSINNLGYYLAVNPEAPCGGFYTANLSTSSMDFSAMDSLRLSFDYYKSSTLNWGGATLELRFDNGSITDTLSSCFGVSDVWTSFDTVLSTNMISSNVTMNISMGGGEAVALDNIEIQGWDLSSSPFFRKENEIKYYPNPAKDFTYISLPYSSKVKLMNSLGNKVKEFNLSKGSNKIDVSGLHPGIYYLRFNKGSKDVETRKLMIK